MHSSKHSVGEIILHPDWNVNAERFDADIAMLVLEEAVKYTNYIRPACLPNAGDAVYLGNGTVVGWGRTEHSDPLSNDIESIPRKAILRRIDAETCYLTDPDVARISSFNTFCTLANENDKGKGPCR